MSEISGRTLMMAIQAVAETRDKLDKEIATAEGGEQADLQELELSYARAAAELKRAYLEALETSANLPPYSALVEE